ncbi:uncharacterized protein LOC123010661 [Tribolium madens]|uniref:uncharacterized protein LOC123010661 n=1 Tax=Tribolium madens TaxID=41895 RepID=UPI001CF751D0|nr:uncharacterized protein LOC123010661 [Tribolium madens]
MSKTKTAYNTNCCVPGCNSKKSSNRSLHFHHFPRNDEPPITIVNSWGTKEKVSRKKLWEVLLMKKEAAPGLVVCSLHFRKEDYLARSDAILVQKARLKKTAVPSLKLPKIDTKLSSRKHKTSNLNMGNFVKH